MTKKDRATDYNLLPQLSEKEVQASCRTLEDQWFNNASELEALDVEAFRLLSDIPPRLSNAIMRSFGKGTVRHLEHRTLSIWENARTVSYPLVLFLFSLGVVFFFVCSSSNRSVL